MNSQLWATACRAALFRTIAFLVAINQVAILWAASPVASWIRQIGTPSADGGQGVSADGFNSVYTIGSTTGSLGGPNNGASDLFLTRYDSNGSQIWMRQYGDVGEDIGLQVSAKEPGVVYFSGTHGFTPAGSSDLIIDAFIGKYDAAGSLQWVQPFASEFADRGTGVAADGVGSVYLAGGTGGSLLGSISDNQDAFLRKYNANGALLWARTLASPVFDSANSVATDDLGNVYIGGLTRGDLAATNSGDTDAFVTKYDGNGTIIWTRQFGTNGADYISEVAADSLGHILVVGTTEGSLAGTNAGFVDAFLRKYDSNGNLQWTKQLGTATNDQGFGVTSDGQGNVYISVATGVRFGSTDEDVFVSKFDPAGNSMWTLQLGSSARDQGFGISADGFSNVYVAGLTQGSFGGPIGGNQDAFLLKITEVPEPTGYALALTVLLFLAVARIRFGVSHA